MNCFKNLVFLGLFGVVAGGVACGDDDDGGDGSSALDTGLPEMTQLQDVTPQQFTDACNSLRSSLEVRFSEDRMTQVLCEAVGAVLSEDAGACREFADECVTESGSGENAFFDPEMIDVAENFDCGTMAEFESCTATVGEYERCLTDTMNLVDEFFNSLSCANAGNVDMSTLEEGNPLETMDPPPSCAALEEECPGLSGFDVE